MLDKSQLESIFLSIKNKHSNSESKVNRYRAYGYLEGILVAFGDMKPGEEFDYKTIEYIEVGWFGKESIKTREQTYSEYIMERFENFLNKMV